MNGKLVESRIYETPKSYDSVKCLCYEAKDLGLKSVQVFPCMIDICKEILNETDIEINAMISWPHGGFSIEQKAAEAKELAAKGAKAVEVVVNTREIKSHNYEYVYEEMCTVKKALPEDITLKFNMEIECLTEEEIRETAQMALKAGIDYLCTSTGLYHALDENKNDVPLVASPEEVKLLKDIVGDQIKIQAEGYISTPEIAKSLVDAGASLISTEYAYEVMK